MTEGTTLEEFFADFDKMIEPIIRLAALKELMRETDGLHGTDNPKSPKWARRKKGEIWESDKGYVE